MAVITDDGRLYFHTIYEHTSGVWSIPIENQKELWNILDFTYAVDDDKSVFGMRYEMASIGNRVVADATQPPGKRLLLTTDDKGRNWKTFYEGKIREFNFINNNIGFVLGDDIKKTIDGGKSWLKIADLPLEITEFEKTDEENQTNFVVDMNFADEQKGYIVGSKGFLIVTNDSGKSWQKMNTGIATNLWGIKSLNENYAWAVGDKGVVLETSDGGVSWKKIDVGLKEDIYSGLYDSNLHIDKQRQAVWIIKDGKIRRKTINL